MEKDTAHVRHLCLLFKCLLQGFQAADSSHAINLLAPGLFKVNTMSCHNMSTDCHGHVTCMLVLVPTPVSASAVSSEQMIKFIVHSFQPNNINSL